MVEILAILSVVMSITVGFQVLLLFKFLEKKTLLEKICFSYGVGMGAIGSQLVVYSLFGIEWSKFTIVLPWVLLMSFQWKGNLQNFQKIDFSFLKLRTTQEKILGLILSFVIVYVIFEVTLRPLLAWDGWSTWFIMGKAFYIDGSINLNIVKYINVSYPPLMGAFLSFVFIILGRVDDTAALLPLCFFYIFILLLFFLEVQKYANKQISLLFTILLAMTPNLIRHASRFDVGHADLTLSYFFFCSILLLNNYIQKKSMKNIILLNIFLGVGSLIKSEGIAFLFVVQTVVLYLIIKEKKYKDVIGLGVGLVFIIVWEFFKSMYTLPSNPFVWHLPDFARTYKITLYIFLEFINIQRWNFLWIGFFTSLLMFKKKYGFWLFVVLSQFIIYITVYFNTPVDPILHIQNSFDRLLLHLAPLSVFLTALNFSSILKSKKRL